MADASCPWLIPFIVTLVLLIMTVLGIIVSLILRKSPGRWGRLRTSIHYLQTTVRRRKRFKGDLEQDNYIDIEDTLKNAKFKEDRPYSSLKIGNSTNQEDTYLEPSMCKQIKPSNGKGGVFAALAVRHKGSQLNVVDETIPEAKKKGKEEAEEDSSSDDYIQPPI